MGPETGNAACLTVSHRFHDADALTHAIRGADVEYVALSKGPYESRLTALLLDGVIVQRAIDRAHIARGTVDRAWASLLLPMGLLRDPMVNGDRLEDAQIVLLRPGAEFHSICQDAQDWASLSLRPDALEVLVELWGLATPLERTPTVLCAPPAEFRHLQCAITAVTDLADHLPRTIEAPGVATAIARSILDLLASLHVSNYGTSAFHKTKEASRLIAAAEQYFSSHIEKPIYSSDLCAALGVSQRKLQYAFLAAYGCSPQAYLKSRRLILARRALKSGNAGTRLVKSVALSHGFWHLGNFAREYRAYFGDPPSETLRAAHPDGSRPDTTG